MADQSTELEWHLVANLDELPEGRVKTVTAGTLSMALTHIDGQFTAMDNRCPHQAGPLEKALLKRARTVNAGYAARGTVGISTQRRRIAGRS